MCVLRRFTPTLTWFQDTSTEPVRTLKQYLGALGLEPVPPPPPSSAWTRRREVKQGKSGGSVGTTDQGNGKGRSGVRLMGTAAYGGKGQGKGKGRGDGRLGQGGRGRSKGGEKPMGTTAYGGKGSKGSEWRSASRRRQLQTRSSHHGVMPTPPPREPPLTTIRQYQRATPDAHANAWVACPYRPRWGQGASREASDRSLCCMISQVGSQSCCRGHGHRMAPNTAPHHQKGPDPPNPPQRRFGRHQR